MNYLTRSNAVKSALRFAFAAGLPVMLLGACSTRIVSAETAADMNPPEVKNQVVLDEEPGIWWAHQYSLPVEVHGNIPGHSPAEIASLSQRTGPAPQDPTSTSVPGGRILMYLNPAQLPDDEALCAEPRHVGVTHRSGDDTSVAVALCDDTKTLAAVHGVVTADASDEEIKSGLGTFQSQLFWELYKTPWMP